MTLFTYVRDSDTSRPIFAVVASDSGARYVFPSGVTPWLDIESRLPFIKTDEENPSTEQEWLTIALRNLGDGLDVDHPYDDVDDPDELIQETLDTVQESEAGPNVTDQQTIADAFRQVSADYPGFGDDDDTDDGNEGISSEAMDNFVLMALGPIDPDGPNGWILRAMDGNPAPGDEDAYVHFPGTITSNQEGD